MYIIELTAILSIGNCKDIWNLYNNAEDKDIMYLAITGKFFNYLQAIHYRPIPTYHFLKKNVFCKNYVQTINVSGYL